MDRVMLPAMLMSWQEFVAFVGSGLRELLQTDFSQVHYGNAGFAGSLGVVVLAAAALTLARLTLRRRPHYRSHSGHLISRKHQLGILGRVLYSAPKLVLAGAVALLLVAAADPFLASTEEYAGSVDSRERVDLIDVSGSMAWEFPGTQKSKAQVAREAHLKFLEMRRGKNDRVSLWLFSTYPYMIDDFVTDDELYYFQAWDAPYVMSSVVARWMIVPADRLRIIPAEGDTNIVRPLRAIIRQFDQDEISSGHHGGQHRALLVITDGAVTEFPGEELAELRKRNIRPYIIFVNANPKGEVVLPGDAPPLIEQIRSFGGDYFDVTNPAGLSKAYEAIDSREAVRYEVRHRALKVPIHSRLLIASMMLLLVGIPLGLIAEVFGGTYP
jgi:hypothetical protein